MSAACPTCGGPGGVMLLLTVAPCDRCAGHSTSPVAQPTGRVRFLAVVDGWEVHRVDLSGLREFTIPEGFTHAWWVQRIASDDTALVNLCAPGWEISKIIGSRTILEEEISEGRWDILLIKP